MILELLLVIFDFRLAELNSTARKPNLPFMEVCELPFRMRSVNLILFSSYQQH
jgi:hypothetical protein